MDNLVLVRVASTLNEQLRSAVVEDVHSDGRHRYRLGLRAEERRRSVVVSLRPELPWIGGPAVRRKGKAARRGDAFAATEVWKTGEADSQFNTPVLKGGHLYGMSARGNLFCLNAETGALAWLDETPRGRGGFAAIVDAGPALLVLPSGGELLVVEPDPAGLKELATYKVSDGQTYAHPVPADGGLFIKDLQALTLWTMN